MPSKTRDMTLVALFASLTAIGAFIRIDTPLVPFTLQFAFCAYAGLILGARKGALSMIVYVTIGLIGFPVFTRGGGPSYIFEPTFGYLIGFIVCAPIIGWLTETIQDFKSRRAIIRITFAVAMGLGVLYLIGMVYLYFVMNAVIGTPMSLYGAFVGGVLPFIAGDFITGALVILTSLKILPVIKESGRFRSHPVNE
ncbi:MAG: biotin transporter BioY [Candidatus Izemoplasmataceae bacterium]